MVTIAEARADFAAAENWIYLDTASTGIMPRAGIDAVQHFIGDLNANAATKSKWADALDGARAAFARLINAEPADVAFAGNTTEGVNFVASGLDWRPGDNVVVCAELEHPANLYPWLAARQRGLEVRMVPPTDNAIDVDALITAADERTRSITVSTVTFVPGYRTDLQTLGRFCRKRDIFLLVDATQSAGVLHTDVEDLLIDGLAVSGHKYLLSFYGMGAFWCRRAWAERMTPTHLGKPGVVIGDQHPDHNDYAVTLMGDARRFETRHLYVGAAALRASCAYLTALGTRTIETHVTALSARLAEDLEGLGLPVNRDPFGQGLTNIVTVGALTGDGLHDTSDPVLQAVLDYLAANRVCLSTRRGMLRFSLHLYNNAADVDRVLELTKEALRKSHNLREAAKAGAAE